MEAFMPYSNIPDDPVLQAKMDDCVKKVQAKGHDKESAIAICYASIVEGQTAAHDFVTDTFAAITKTVGGESFPASDFLVVEDPQQPSTWHLQIKRHGKLDHGLMGAAWAALHGGYRGNKYEGPNKQAAIAKLRKYYDVENLSTPSEHSSDFLLDEFVATRPGQPYRLFPFGKIIKNGKTRNITPEYAALFKLPHFKPPVKLGSHDDTTPAGGHILRLEVLKDGLYAYPELTDKGATAISEGAYRYHSPEVIWEDGGLENPETGEIISGPMIVGDALLHTPHLGEATALYSIEPMQVEGGVRTMDNETVQVPKSLWDKFMATLFPTKAEPAAPAPEPTPAPVTTAPEVEQYKAKVAELEAKVKERDDLEAKLKAIEAETAYKARVDKFQADLKPTKYSAAEDVAKLLADLPDDKAAKVLELIKALSAQIDESALTSEKGVTGMGAQVAGHPALALDAAINAKMAEKKISYLEAYRLVSVEQPSLVESYVTVEKPRK
jgi:Mu-like prophage I protein